MTITIYLKYKKRNNSFFKVVAPSSFYYMFIVFTMDTHTSLRNLQQMEESNIFKHNGQVGKRCILQHCQSLPHNFLYKNKNTKCLYINKNNKS
jgi:hypothetical protein